MNMARNISRRGFLVSTGLVGAAVAAGALVACSSDDDGADVERPSPLAGAASLDRTTVVAHDPTGALTSAALFASTQVAVVVTDDTRLGDGASLSRDHGIPLLVVSSPADRDTVGAELDRLSPDHVLVLGGENAVPGDDDRTTHPVDGTTWPEKVPTGSTASRSGVALASTFTTPASAATAAASGLRLVRTPAADPRSTDESIDAVTGADADGSPVVALGDRFGDTDTVARRVHLAGEVSERIPGGGGVVFPGRRMVALYGHPSGPALGCLGEQDRDAAVTRAKEAADLYAPLSDVPVVPTFEIIATVAASEAGPSGTFSNYTDPGEIEPWIDAIVRGGGYAIIDVQPGREKLLTQVRHYEDLIRRPGVGVALDPEWRLGPGEQPLSQVGHVPAEEINEVVDWLDHLVAEEKLQQKLLMIHQFQLQMIRDRERMSVGTDNVCVAVHCDGHGGTDIKMETWNVVRKGLDPRIGLGWKNFYDEDQPMLTPEQTMQVRPAPDFVSYQ
ncbi:cell wall-binding repeat-containing protein [Corynebacterium bovis]|uniref:cell wall-binding repeat-containing protein n=2 Tax=Corynebacterium bovis TaxID=36808 RepID=UPI000F64234E|nr:cell wall-binding repeat-containing protein [Corynebacterium bovis]RRO89298.1 cell wall-binding repeat 2 family protein [Corynebacterium bovis]